MTKDNIYLLLYPYNALSSTHTTSPPPPTNTHTNVSSPSPHPLTLTPRATVEVVKAYMFFSTYALSQPGLYGMYDTRKVRRSHIDM